MATADDGAGPATKLQEQATGKGAYSYSYFAASCQTTTISEPRKLTDEEVAAQQEAERQRSVQGASAWNHAGTFEERDWTAWAMERLHSLLSGRVGTSDLQVTKVAVDKGHANTWVVRGKKKVGFDFELTVSWCTSLGGKEVKGTVRVPNAASDELDDLQLESPEITGGAQPTASKQVQQLLPIHVKQGLEQLLDELKQK